MNLSQTRFGRLVAQWPVGREGKSFRIVWLCVCDCGKISLVRTNHLRGGHIRSCGCLLSDLLVKRNKTTPPSFRHGHAARDNPSREYSSWEGMIQRCTNPNHPKYKYWGGRGIKVCERWRIFDNFLADMGERPLGKSIDRFPNNDGNYEPGNCRWATQSEQNFNTRRSLAKAGRR